MAYTINGFGTSFIAASRPRARGGSGDYDAVEAVAFMFCPFIAFRVVYVLAHWSDPDDFESDRLQTVPLRFSRRIIMKAYLRAWGNAMFFYGGGITICVLALVAVMAARAAMNRQPVTPEQIEWTPVLAIGALFVVVAVGAVCRFLYRRLDEPDNRIRDAIGSARFGHPCPDPYYWPDDVADSVRGKVLEQEVLPSLLGLAQLAMLDGDRPKAVFYARLAMRYESEADGAQELLDEALGR